MIGKPNIREARSGDGAILVHEGAQKDQVGRARARGSLNLWVFLVQNHWET